MDGEGSEGVRGEQLLGHLGVTLGVLGVVYFGEWLWGTEWWWHFALLIFAVATIRDALLR